MDGWQDKGLNEPMREAQKAYLRWEEEKTKMKAKIMVAVARERAGFRNGDFTGRGKSEYVGTGKPELKGQTGQRKEIDRKRKAPWVDGRMPWMAITCYYCNESGHTQKYCKTREMDEVIAKEQDTLEKILKGEG